MTTLTQNALQGLLIYDSDTGVFTNRVDRSPTSRQGAIAGTDHPDGYRRIKILGKCYLSHRLAWLHAYGEWPSNQIDHVNGVRNDNRLANLRSVSHKENMENQKLHIGSVSGYRGITWDKEVCKWSAQVRHEGHNHKVGRFDRLEDAVIAVKTKRDQLFTHHKTEYSA